MKKQELNRLANPIFIVSVVLLILNDFYLKATFGNIITGKLSDLAGLFAFPFFFKLLNTKTQKNAPYNHILSFRFVEE